MTFDPHQQSNLEAFEERLRGLSPRPPVQPWLLPQSEDATSQRELMERWVRLANYRTIGISATCGALLGGLVSAACTLFLLQQPAPEVSSQPLPSIQSLSESDLPTFPANPPAGFGMPRDPNVVEAQLAISTQSAPTPLHWWNDPYATPPSTLAVGSRFVSHRSDSIEAIADGRSSGWKTHPNQSRATLERPLATDRLLPQRQWMQLMLNSPPQFF